MALRSFLAKLEKEDKLVRIKKEVSVKYEIANIIYSLSEKPVIFDKLPLLFHLPGDGGRYATATVATIKDPDTGRNVAYHRLMQRSKNKFTARLIKGRQTRTTYDKIKGDLEMAVCIGNSVPVMVAASLGPPSGVDEFAIANALDRTDLVKCVTKDLEVPADSEIVLEGRLTKDLDKEGPFVDQQ